LLSLPGLVSPAYILYHPAAGARPAVSSGPVGYTPAQIRNAYGFNQIPLNGAGQTIAIVDAYDDPSIAGDLHAFDQQFGLADPTLVKVNQWGGTSYPAPDPNWAVEISLDVEWAHAIAPGAGILLVEANSNSYSDLLTAVDYARSRAGVSEVSMSWGGSEFSGENTYDSHFTTPSGHQGVTFVVSSGDSGTISYPAASPEVLAVGGTTLKIGPGNTYVGETAWSGSGGGISAYESMPGYQGGIAPGSMRTNPDVAYDADPNTGFAVRDSYTFGSATPWGQIGGTSAGAPQWAALIALADQGRAQRGLGSLDGPSQTLPLLYDTPGSAFHDITSGSNAHYSAGLGYDLVTGLGTPVANQTVAGLEQLNWSSLAGGVSAITASTLPGGGQEVFAIASDHAVWTRTQAGPGGPWSNWSSLGGAVSAITVAKESNGDLELFAIATTAGDGIWSKTLNPATGTWSPNWFNLGSFTASAMTVGTDSHGNLVLFYIATYADPAIGASPGAVYTRTQDAATGIWTPNWTCLYGAVSAITAGTDSNGDLELFAIATTAGDGIWNKTLNPATGTWSSSWFSLGSGGDYAITVGKDSHGNLVLFAIASDRGVWTRTQAGPGGPWSSWLSLGGAVSAITVGTDSNGNLELFGTTIGDDAVWTRTLYAATGTWSSSWSALDFLASAITVDTNSDGSLEVFAISSFDQAVWTTRVP
jgi:hypothetical protein